MKDFIALEYENMLNTLRELCGIPAPSFCEDRRAEYIKNALESFGAEGVYIDEVKNVIYEVNCSDDEEFAVIAAHTDTVFPDMEPMPVVEDDINISNPGVGDDTASCAVLLYAVKYLLAEGFLKDKHVMFVFNSCEEGLGNLRGIKNVVEKFGNRIKKFVSFDSSVGVAVDRAVGSVRYKVKVETSGGHSFGKFGNENAINVLSKIVNSIYSIEVPSKTGTKTTYNVGTIAGGTSVNTIAQNAEMLCEYRSSDSECMKIMDRRFMEIFESYISDKAKIEVESVGNRPCMGDVSEIEMTCLRKLISDINSKYGGVKETVFNEGSTDCNVPLAMGIPSICIGVYNGHGSHTREETVEKESLKIGLEIAVHFIEGLMA